MVFGVETLCQLRRYDHGVGFLTRKTKLYDGVSVNSGAGMDRPGSFLESELERALAVHGEAPADENVVPISNAVRSQATLRERDRRFRELLDALPAAVYTTDAEGRITYYNEAAAEMWGHRPRSARANGAARGSCSGRTERHCRTASARWRLR